MASVEERFWSKVSKGDGCWEWLGYKSPRGQGRFLYPGAKSMGLAYRASWEINRGPIPKELCVLHRCDNPSCVRPDHLFLGTQADNVADMDAKGRRRTRTRRGEDSNKAKLTTFKVAELRERRARGETFRSLARAFGITKSSAYAAAVGRSWGHVPVRVPRGSVGSA